MPAVNRSPRGIDRGGSPGPLATMLAVLAGALLTVAIVCAAALWRAAGG